MKVWWPYLDLTRGLAALLVASGHLRAFVFRDFNEVDHPSPFCYLFYFATGFGHQAVIVFFVLSGFLVGGAVLSRVKTAQWSWTDYAIMRVTRLWIVLIPALLLTALWDHLGIVLTGSPFYTGELSSTYNIGPEADPSRYNIVSALGNLVFLQTIAVPTFGSNGPLWSLANEFWYYVLFPLLFFSVTAKAKTFGKLGAAIAAFAICYMLPSSITISGSIWLLGVGAFALGSAVDLTLFLRRSLLVTSGATLAAALTLSRISYLNGMIADVAIGATFSAMLVPLSQMRSVRPSIEKLSHAGAEFSYTLYLVHFPLAAFFACYVLQNRRLMPDLVSGAIYTGLLAIILIYAYGTYYLFERNTHTVRKAISAAFSHVRQWQCGH